MSTRRRLQIPTDVRQRLECFGQLRPDVQFFVDGSETRIVFQQSRKGVDAFVRRLRIGQEAAIQRFHGRDKERVVAVIVERFFGGRGCELYGRDS